MESAAGAILAGAVAFAATNVDDLLLLVAFLASGTYRARDVVLGQYAGIALLFAVSIAASLAALAMPADALSLLGLIPIAIGLKQLIDGATREDALPAATGFLPVAAVTIANGGDNIGVYAPLFAVSSAPAVGIYAAVFALLTALWCVAARWLVRHPAAGARLRRYGPRLAPCAVIAIGLVVLAG